MNDSVSMEETKIGRQRAELKKTNKVDNRIPYCNALM